MIYKFPYKEFEPIEIPDALISGVYTLADTTPSMSNTEIVRTALDNPIGTKRLGDEVSVDMKIVIAVDDSSRSTHTELMLPLVLKQLTDAGISSKNITVLIALGTHRKMTRNEMEQKYTADAVDRYRFVNPDWKDASAYIKAGVSSRGFDIRIHKEILEADYVIGVGQTIPHMIAGFGGGCKIINPGCADGDTIGEMHWLCSEVPEDSLFAVRDNLVRQTIDEVAIKAGLKFIINEVPGSHSHIAGAFAGHPVQAHREACDFAKRICQVPIKEKADIVIADAYPADLDFWQALKGVNAAYGAVKDGGTVICVTPCSEGTSSQHKELVTLGYIPVKQVRQLVREGNLDKAIAANLLLGRRLLDKADGILVTKGISEKDTLAMGFGWAPDPAAALKQALSKHPEPASVNVLHKASKMICTVCD